MVKLVKCDPLLSLKEACVRRLANLLSKDSNILANTLHFIEFQSISNKKWQEFVETMLKNKFRQLNLLESLLEKVVDDLPMIGLEIRRWQTISKSYFTFDVAKDSSKFRWITGGTIDYRKTAEVFLCYSEQSVDELYKIACEYCLEDYIPLIWSELPENQREYYSSLTDNFSGLKFCWPHIMKGELFKLDFLWASSNTNLTSFNQWAFEYSVENGNAIATEYFFQKLTHKEREVSLLRITHWDHRYRSGILLSREGHFDVLFCLLRLMTPEQQMELVKARPVDILLYFLDLPRSDLCVENAELIWSFLPLAKYSDLIRQVADKFIYSDSNFPKMFERLLKQSPLDFKLFFVNREAQYGTTSTASNFLHLFFDAEDSKSLQVMLRNMEAIDRVNLAFENNVLIAYCNCLFTYKLHMVEIFLLEVKLTKEDRDKLTTKLIRHMDWTDILGKEFFISNWVRILESLDETDATSDLYSNLSCLY